MNIHKFINISLIKKLRPKSDKQKNKKIKKIKKKKQKKKNKKKKKKSNILNKISPISGYTLGCTPFFFVCINGKSYGNIILSRGLQ